MVLSQTLLIGILTLASFLPTVYAIDDYTVLAPLPNTTIGDCTGTGCKTNFATYLPGVFKFAIGLAALMAFAVISYGGFLLMTTDSVMGKDEGKKHVENAVKGLLLVIGAYAILYTINPQFLSFNLDIRRITLAPNASGGGQGFGSVSGCTNCQSLEALNLPCAVSRNQVMISCGAVGVSTGFGATLRNFNSTFGDGWVVTDASPPREGVHTDTCHTNGTCVDAMVTNPTPANINRFYTTARGSGMTGTVFEVPSQAIADGLRRAGVTIPITVNTRATGNHFHVK